MLCSRCNKEITEQQSYVSKGKIYCEDCLMDIGLNKGECDPWATYVDNRTRAHAGQTGTDGLTELERQVYDFVKAKGKATRAEVIQELKLTQAELNTQLTPMLHADIIKEKSEGGKQFLVALK